MKQWMQCTLAAAMAFAPAMAMAQTSAPVKDDLFAGTEIFAKNASDVTEVTMDPASLDMVDGKRSPNARSMVLNVVRTYSYDKPGMYRIEDVEAFRNKLNTGAWHCSVHTRSLKTGESSDICNKQRTDDLTETAIITVEPKSLTFIHTITHGGGWTPKGRMEGMPLVTMRDMPALAMLDAGALPNLHGNVDLAVNEAMDRVRAMDLDAMQAKIRAGMKDLDKLDSRQMQRQIDDATRVLEDAEKQQNEIQSEPSSPKQPE